MARVLSSNDVRVFVATVQKIIADMKADKASTEEKIKAFRACFFDSFRLSDSVPAPLVPAFIRFAEKFYNPASTGYNGIIAEIRERVTLYADIFDSVQVREFLKHGDGKTDIYDSDNKIPYEMKSGCGDWLRSERFDTFEDVLQEYRRKRTRLLWKYSYVARPEGMTGKKSVNNSLTDEEKAKAQESTKTRKDGTKIVNKEYSINIDIDCSYREFFDYLATYPAGIKTFFKESKRSGVAGVFVWELQTIKNSKKKIDFLQACPFNRAKPEEQETEETED